VSTSLSNTDIAPFMDKNIRSIADGTNDLGLNFGRSRGTGVTETLRSPKPQLEVRFLGPPLVAERDSAIGADRNSRTPSGFREAARRQGRAGLHRLMIRIRKRNSRPLVGALAILAAGAIVGVLSAFTAAAEPGATSRATAEACAQADTPAVEASVREVRKWIRCRINEERAVHGVDEVAANDSLRKAATHHAKTMVKTRCLAHKCPGERNLGTRIRRSGYPAGADSWEYAEDTGCGVSADAMIENWLAIQFHRINILNDRFEDVGVGVAQEPVKGRCDKDFATFAVVFGHRS
jgi:uncharacterized protein YkwD